MSAWKVGWQGLWKLKREVEGELDECGRRGQSWAGREYEYGCVSQRRPLNGGVGWRRKGGVQDGFEGGRCEEVGLI